MGRLDICPPSFLDIRGNISLKIAKFVQLVFTYCRCWQNLRSCPPSFYKIAPPLPCLYKSLTVSNFVPCVKMSTKPLKIHHTQSNHKTRCVKCVQVSIKVLKSRGTRAGKCKNHHISKIIYCLIFSHSAKCALGLLKIAIFLIAFLSFTLLL